MNLTDALTGPRRRNRGNDPPGRSVTLVLFPVQSEMVEAVPLARALDLAGAESALLIARQKFLLAGVFVKFHLELFFQPARFCTR